MRVLKSLLWIAMAACLFAGGVLLLLGCDFAKPSFLNFGGAFCPKRVDLSGLQQEHDRQDELLGKIHEAELRLAGLPNCQAPTPMPTPSPQPKHDDGPKVGKRGNLEVTLWWETKDDLDLNVFCPRGAIKPNNASTKGPGICGDGIHDVDANRNLINPVLDPKEHIVWISDIPDFVYRVYVIPKRTLNSSPITYHTRVDFDGESVTCSGQVQWDRESKQGYGQYSIEFTPKHPLPSCENKNDPLHACTLDESNCLKP